MQHLKVISISFLFCIVSSFSSFSQNPYNYPYAEDSINLIKGAPDKATLPFDKPFYLIINSPAYNIDNSQIIGVFAYKTVYKGKKRVMKNEKKGIFYPDISFKLGINYDTVGGRLAINFPALKPNQDFDIAIHIALNANQRYELLSIVKLFNDKKPIEATAMFNKISKELAFPENYRPLIGRIPIRTFKYGDLSEFIEDRKPTLYNVIRHITETSYEKFSIGTNAQIKNTLLAADANKIQNDFLYFLSTRGISATDIEEGILPLSSIPGEKSEVLDVIIRLKNVTTTLNVLNQIKEALWQVYLKTNDANVGKLLSITKTNIEHLRNNQKKLKDLNAEVIKETDDNGDTYQGVWLIGSNKNFNLTTRGSHIFSTQLGMTNLTIRNNSNKIQNIQKLFTGINISFRSVDRNLPLTHLWKSDGTDRLSTRYNLFQHLTLSLGLTFGDFDQSDANRKDFQNLFGGMSLIAGPSYRFGKAFCLSAGAAFLRRNNPNPLVTGSVLTVGFYSSFSLDFDLLSTISNVTGRILK